MDQFPQDFLRSFNNTVSENERFRRPHKNTKNSCIFFKNTVLIGICYCPGTNKVNVLNDS